MMREIICISTESIKTQLLYLHSLFFRLKNCEKDTKMISLFSNNDRTLHFSCIITLSHSHKLYAVKFKFGFFNDDR